MAEAPSRFPKLETVKLVLATPVSATHYNHVMADQVTVPQLFKGRGIKLLMGRAEVDQNMVWNVGDGVEKWLGNSLVWF